MAKVNSKQNKLNKQTKTKTDSKQAKAKQAQREASQKSLQRTIKSITKKYGKGSIMEMSSRPQNIATIPTGSLALDQALGVGGYPKGRVIEIYGPESSGKTTMALEATAQVQKRGGRVAYIDAENALDPQYAKALGVDVKHLLLSQPNTGEEGLDICEQLVASSSISLVVVDSVPALVPAAVIRGEMGDQHVGLQARMMSQALAKLTGIMNQTHTTVIFINQTREKIGVFYGNPETTPGGKALKFYASVIMRISRHQRITRGKQIIGNHTRINIKKNKVAPPFRQCHVDIMYGTGLSRTGELVDMAAKKGIIKRAGAWYSYQGHNIAQGRESAKKYMHDNPKVAKEVYLKVRKAYHIDND